MESDFLELMPHTVTIAPLTGRDAYGKPIYGTGTQYRARVVGKQKLIRAADGTEKVCQTIVYVAGTPGTDPEYRITLPDGSQPPILAVSKVPDETGDHHEVIHCG